MSFEKNLEKLDDIAKKFENEKLSLSESVKLFEESLQLSEASMKYLSEADGKIKKLKLEMDKLTEEDY